MTVPERVTTATGSMQEVYGDLEIGDTGRGKGGPRGFDKRPYSGI